MQQVITGLYETPKRAAEAVRVLESKGIAAGAISLLIGDNFASRPQRPQSDQGIARLSDFS